MRTHRSNVFSPRVEALESRMCLSCTIAVSGDTLRITGDASVNNVAVTHDGAGEVTATCTAAPGGPAGDDAETASGINRIIIDTKNRNDTVDIDVTGELTTPLDLRLELGVGNDTADLLVAGAIAANLNVRADLGGGSDSLSVNLDQEISAGADVALAVQGQTGDDTLNLSVNEVREAATLNVNFDGGNNRDTLNVFLGDAIDADAEVTIRAHGGNGRDTLNVDGTTHGTGGDIAEGASLDIRLEGGSDGDNINVSYSGDVAGDLDVRIGGGNGNDTINFSYGPEEIPGAPPEEIPVETVSANITGKLKLHIEGGNNNDTVAANITVGADSTGELDARVDGNSGRDDLTLNVFDLTETLVGDELVSALAEIKALIDGGVGVDVCTHTPNVETKNCETHVDTVI